MRANPDLIEMEKGCSLLGGRSDWDTIRADVQEYRNLRGRINGLSESLLRAGGQLAFLSWPSARFLLPHGRYLLEVLRPLAGQRGVTATRPERSSSRWFHCGDTLLYDVAGKSQCGLEGFAGAADCRCGEVECHVGLGEKSANCFKVVAG